MSQRLLQLAAAMAMLLASMWSAAQPYPSRPVRIVVPVSAGGLQDTMARAIAHELAKAWGQNILVESRPGANGIIATDFVAKSAPDGYTVLMNDSAPLTINPFLYRKLPYDAVKDFMPVIGLVQVAYLMVANPQFPPNTLQEVFALAKAKPGEINYASYGIGSSNHLETEALSNQAGVRFNHVPYKGGAELLPALFSGQIQFALVGVAPVLAHLRQGRLKPIVYGATQRSVLLPEVPTISESGLPGYDSRAWLGWFVPAATPRPVADKIAADVGRIITAPEFLNKYVTSIGLELLNLPPEPFAEFVRAERNKNAGRLSKIPLRLD